MLSENLRKAREKMGYSRKILGEKTNITATAIQYIEVGITKNPKMITLENLSKALNVSIDELIK